MLTARRIKTVQSTSKRKEIPDGLIPGMYFVVQPSGAKSWALRYRYRGLPRKLTLGSYPGVDLVPARDLARAALDKVARDVDPGRERAKARQRSRDASRTLESLLPMYVRYLRENKKRRSWREIERQLQKDVLPQLGKVSVESVSLRDLRDVLLKAETRGATVGVNRLLAAISGFFKWAVEIDLIAKNPVASLGKRHAEISRDRVLSDTELLEVWTAAGVVGGPYGALVRMLALTGQRRGETVRMRRSEIEDDYTTWAIPGSRTKNGKPHDVPLSTTARYILQNRPRDHEALFSNDGSTPIGDWTKMRAKLDTAILKSRREVDAEAEQMPPWTLHDLRRTCATGLARLGIPLHVIEKILNHTGRSFAGVAGVYNRFEFIEERRRALAAWAAHIQTLAVPHTPGNILELKAVRP